jgi:hypothetical protein
MASAKRAHDEVANEDESSSKCARMDAKEEEGPLAHFLPELWGEVLTRLSIRDQLMGVALVCRARSKDAYPLKGATATLSVQCWGQAKVRDPTAGETGGTLFKRHSLTSLAFSFHFDVSGSHPIIIPGISSPWLAHQTNIVSLEICSRLAHVWFAASHTLPEADAAMCRLTQLCIIQSGENAFGNWSNYHGPHGIIVGHMGPLYTNLRRLAIETPSNTERHDARGLNDTFIQSIVRKMPNLCELSLRRVTAINYDLVLITELRHLTKLELLELGTTAPPLFNIMERLTRLVSLRIDCEALRDMSNYVWFFTHRLTTLHCLDMVMWPDRRITRSGPGAPVIETDDPANMVRLEPTW